MSKILVNNTAGTVFINDTGVSIPTATSYTIPPQDYLLWAASSDVVTAVGSADLTVNDGSYNLNISDGIDLIKGLFPSKVAVYQSGTVSSIFDDVAAVASGVSTEVVTYTAAANDKLVKVEFGGTNIAQYDIEINSVVEGRYYSHFGNLNGSADFSSGLTLTAGQTVKVFVLHNRSSTGDFFAKLTILEA